MQWCAWVRYLSAGLGLSNVRRLGSLLIERGLAWWWLACLLAPCFACRQGDAGYARRRLSCTRRFCLGAPFVRSFLRKLVTALSRSPWLVVDLQAAGW